MTMLQRLLCWLAQPAAPLVVRSSIWPATRKAFLRAHPACAVCGSRESVVPHHIRPVQLAPELELTWDNLIPLCQPHHFLVGHLCDWRSWNESVRFDAAIWSERILTRPYRKESVP